MSKLSDLRPVRHLALVALCIATLLTLPGLAYAQGCALCANNASALKAGALAALRSGILILLIPPILIFIGIFVLAFRSRERFGQEGLEQSDLDSELSKWFRSAETLEPFRCNPYPPDSKKDRLGRW